MKEIKKSNLILTREEALAFFRTKPDYYNKQTKRYYCQGDNCERTLTENEVIDDHIDNDRTNNKRTNHQPLCKGCNTHNSGKPMDQQKKIQDKLKKKRKSNLLSAFKKQQDYSPQMIQSRIVFAKFWNHVIEYVYVTDPAPAYKECLDEGCAFITTSTRGEIIAIQSTCENYLKQMLAPSGPLTMEGSGPGASIEIKNKSIDVEKLMIKEWES